MTTCSGYPAPAAGYTKEHISPILPKALRKVIVVLLLRYYTLAFISYTTMVESLHPNYVISTIGQIYKTILELLLNHHILIFLGHHCTQNNYELLLPGNETK